MNDTDLESRLTALRECPTCEGFGYTSPDRYGYYAVTCDACSGTGEIDDFDIEEEFERAPTWQEALGSTLLTVGKFDAERKRAASAVRDLFAKAAA